MHVRISFAWLLDTGAYFFVLRAIGNTAATASATTTAATTATIAGSIISHGGRRCEINVGDCLLVNYFGDLGRVWKRARGFQVKKI